MFREIYFILGEVGQWIQVDLSAPLVVTGVVTQGRHSIQFDQWVESYKIAFGNSTNALQGIKNKNGTDQVSKIVCQIMKKRTKRTEVQINEVFKVGAIVIDWSRVDYIFIDPAVLEIIYFNHHLSTFLIIIFIGNPDVSI